MVLYLTVRYEPTSAPCVMDLHPTLCHGLTSHPASWSYTLPCVMDLHLTLRVGFKSHPVSWTYTSPCVMDLHLTLCHGLIFFSNT